jgi:hypothetical protein
MRARCVVVKILAMGTTFAFFKTDFYAIIKIGFYLYAYLFGLR